MKLKRWQKILLVVLFISGIALRCSLRFELLMNGYNPFDYEVYRKFDSEFIMNIHNENSEKHKEYTCKWIVQVNDFDKQFNHIEIARTKWMNWDIIEIGESSNNETNTSVLSWPESFFINKEKDFDIGYTHHKIFRIRKSHISISDLRVKLEELQDGIKYVFKENEDTYTIEIFDTPEKYVGDIIYNTNFK